MESRRSGDQRTSEFLSDFNSAVAGVQAELHRGARTRNCAGLSAGAAVLPDFSPARFKDSRHFGSDLDGPFIWRYDKF